MEDTKVEDTLFQYLFVIFCMKHFLSTFALILTLSNITAQESQTTLAVLDFEGQGVTPFYGLYNFCKKYFKFKKSSKVLGTLFNNVVQWENGEILRKGEPGKKFEEQGLWINWNRLTKDFVSPSIKNIIKKDNSNSQYDEKWILEDVPKYINERVDFYNKHFIPESKYYITDKTIALIK